MTRIDQRLQTVRLSRSAGVGRSLHRDPAGLDRPSPFLNFGLDEFLQIFRRAALARDEIGADLLHPRSEEHTSELQSLRHIVCRLLLVKKENTNSNDAVA